ncbi:MAG: 3-dehydroquinate synthase [Chloroflexota bacterium]|nr:MAG: 3-dehydroquinate synthase [Chloroflexota bacterium]
MSNPQAARRSSLFFLYGPPASGKSTIGNLLAESLALPFVDLDQCIEGETNLSIPEIFAKEGEQGFRAHEKKLLLETLKMDWGVIALGGGALLDPENRSLVERAGPVICLTTSPEALLERSGSTSNKRPLLAEGEQNRVSNDRLMNLLAQRESHYASFVNQVETHSKSPEELVWEIQIQMGAFHLRGMASSGVRGPSLEDNLTRPAPLGYDVRVYRRILDDIGDLFNQNKLISPISLVTDQNVAPFYLSRTVESLQAAGFTVHPVVIPPGEASKTMEVVSYLWQQFLEDGLERQGTVIALGGGVVGDLAGFAAATYQRGVRWVILPTSLLAMADASLGGKTGADLPQGKNLVGAFHAPQLVLTDPDALETLPQGELRSGMAEVIKAGIIGDATLFENCGQGWQEIESNWDEFIRRAMAVKIKVIEADPYEGGLRAVLNLGHTIGHAVEVVSNYELRHGEAVAIGMVVEARLAEKIGVAESGLADRIGEVCSLLGLPVEIPEGMSTGAIIKAMQADKKRAAGIMRLSLPVRIGEVVPGIEVEDLSSLI